MNLILGLPFAMQGKKHCIMLQGCFAMYNNQHCSMTQVPFTMQDKKTLYALYEEYRAFALFKGECK